MEEEEGEEGSLEDGGRGRVAEGVEEVMMTNKVRINNIPII